MRIRSLVSSVAVLGAFLASSALVGDALAQKGSIMAPSTGWAVSKIGDAGGAYCALARKYNQDTVLTLARNEFSETSFALDFQRPILNQQAAMKVILDQELVSSVLMKLSRFQIRRLLCVWGGILHF